MAKTVVDKTASATGKAQKAGKAAQTSPLVKAPVKEAGRLKSVLSRSSAGASGSRSSTSGAPRGAVATKPHGRVRTFFREVRIELKKVTWPPRKELITSTGVVIIAVAVAAIFIGVFDFVWGLIVRSVGLG